MVKAWREKVVIPTYEVGAPEKNPIFLENRVYQGSSGAVYPYPVIESVSDVKKDVEYNAVFIENEYIKIMVLPELGGRIQMAYDKVGERHFVYYNHVIKPALVGLAGPWISGGIEFNWPQHHRPSTFMPVDCDIENNADGSVTVWVNERERMTHQKALAGFTLRPGCAYLEIRGRLYNPTELTQTFLWWANPAVAVNDYYQSVFPPDIHAVFDHGKRAVSTFPIATGTYYKMDYSAGVDISNYRNIKVPTSYMGVNSRYDFEGGYENDSKGGMLHVASRHVSPGKKQWTWGNGDFGMAWDRNLTDDDGPYIELMAGVFTENQPDFSWLQPYEEKEFTQYFLPYREIGIVKNANKDFLLNIEPTEDGKATLKVFSTSACEAKITIKSDSGEDILDMSVSLSPMKVFNEEISLGEFGMGEISVDITASGRTPLRWHAEPDEIPVIPDAAEAALDPVSIKTNEELFLTGQHLEQYRHATFNPIDYYEEALRRDPFDIRCNNAMGLLMIRKGLFEEAIPYLKKALARQRRRNLNPYDGEPAYNLGIALKFRGKPEEAYEWLYKSTWNGAWQDAGFFTCAQISLAEGRLEDALHEVERSLLRNMTNMKARALKANILRKLGRLDEARKCIGEALADDRFNFGAWFELVLLTGKDDNRERLVSLMRHDSHNYEETALDYIAAGCYDEAIKLLEIPQSLGFASPMVSYYKGYALYCLGDMTGAEEEYRKAAEASPKLCFPNTIHAINPLLAAMRLNPDDSHAPYYLGNLYYDKKCDRIAMELWQKSYELNPDFPTVCRNLALGYYNKRHDGPKALQLMERAFALDETDARILMELDQLRKQLAVDPKIRLSILESYPTLTGSRDDLVVEKATLLNLCERYEEAIDLLNSRQFHPWEGGEGKVVAQYQTARVEVAKKAIAEELYEKAIGLLKECLEYPENLGEGKLFGCQENDFHYLLGVAYKGLGDDEEAAAHFLLALEGPEEPAPAMYYNDAHPDKIFYAGMAYRKLGNESKARSLFYKLINFGERHINDTVKMDYFAVSLPDLLIWDGDLTRSNRIHCLYLLALGYLGLGDMARSGKYLHELMQTDINHQGAKSILSLMRLILD
ncbi:MAG: DUF5107 domain-containing protein [Muribaculaceae bacterium]|nr:DUF5107 domain-containing protein [Muribaculaceae bacterium]